MYILFEGIDTCGKSTQIERIAKQHPDIILTHEPGATPFGKKARKILLEGDIRSKRAELLLFLADRAEHYEEIIKPNHNKTIISDRGFLSGIGYALANGEFEFDQLLRLNRFALEDHLPDKIILFLIDMPDLKLRTTQKTLDGIEKRGLDYLMQVQAHMLESLRKLGIDHLLVNAGDPIETIETHIGEYLGL